MTSTAPAWERVQLARKPERPHSLAYINMLISGFVELHGDRRFSDDPSIVSGIGSFNGRTVMVIGHQKGTNTKENLDRNFGMPGPDGYRKALRTFHHAEKFGFPLICFIDTPGADPGLSSEERGQATAIAENLLALSSLKIPTVGVVIGEGGSGGALAISVTDRLLMLENAVYAVASPEACAAILWKDASAAPEAAEALKLTAQNLYEFEIIDEIIPEPEPAHEASDEAILRTGKTIERHLTEIESIVSDQGIEHLLELRYQKYRNIGAWVDQQEAVISGDSPDLARQNGQTAN
ncbi:MAG: acetyl-CoA carboxylase carboxyltransferase subunit alpha [Sphaerobacteraceae bacterium]|nr:MAG: acetyl-CoA carboxylase carboxyltransferase subunit alpha [Sphaerobacteraceae bacterium]